MSKTDVVCPTCDLDIFLLDHGVMYVEGKKIMIDVCPSCGNRI